LLQIPGKAKATASLAIKGKQGPCYVAVTVGFETSPESALARKTARIRGITSPEITAIHTRCAQSVAAGV